MKRIILVISILLISKVFSQKKNELNVIEISESYANHLGEPIMVQKDSLYVFRTPSIYLVNEKSFLAIKNVYQITIDKDKMTKELVEKYTQTLRRNIDLERRLDINFTKNDSLDQIIYQKTQNTLMNTQKALDYTILGLEKATSSLELVEKANQREKRKGLFEKVLIGIAGIGAGILIGISL